MINSYFKTDSKVIDFSNAQEVTDAYDHGYVLTRIERGRVNQTRSLRVDVSKFSLTSENRRILRKTERLTFTFHSLPYENYTWAIHKLGKEFYSKKFGDGTMSASKIKSMFTEPEEENVNGVFVYENTPNPSYEEGNNSETAKKTQDIHQDLNIGPAIGYCLCYVNDKMLHYAYPFYDLDIDIPNLGLGMMIRAILWAQEQGKQYVYLGSVIDASSKYKLQFEGLEWFNEHTKNWDTNVEQLKETL